MIPILARLLIARNPALTLAHARRLVTVGLAVAGIVLALGAFALWLRLHTQAAVEADRSAAKAEAVSRAREADDRAHEAASASQDSIEASNASAAEAAAKSEDPLKAGLDELRRKR
jgi:hypothetical protein